MEEEDGDASTPFWLQSRRNNTYFRRTSSLGGRATTIATQAFVAGAAAILLVFFIIPPFFSSVSQIFRPHLVRKSWDYLNFVLVLFAVICGFLSRNTGNDESNNNKEEVRNKNNEVINGYSFDKFSSSPSIIDRGRVSNGVATPRYWIDDRGGDQFSDQTVYKRFSRLRSSSSYPDLRLREFETDERWRFYDDTRVSECRYEASDPIYQNQGYRSWREVKPEEDIDRAEGGDGGPKVHSGGFDTEKVEVVATAEAEVVEELTTPSAPPYPPSAPPHPPSPPPSPPRPPPPSKPAKRRTKRVYQDVAPKEEKTERADFVAATPPITPIPPPATVYQKSSKQEKKKGGATKDFLIALRRKKKKQRQQSIDGLDLLFGSDPPFDYSMPPNLPPHPPPPPPPPPFFQGLFSSKKGKSKRTNSNPPPPPPPPPNRNYESRASMAKIRKPSMESRTSKPNPSAQVTQFIGIGSESPLMPIPPPPPPPPFKMPAWKFVKRGDYVRMASNISISSDEPDDDPDVAQSADGKAAGSMFCPSPDVDTKADNFIARFRAGLKLEKMNSVKRERSNLGPEPGPDESES